MAKKNKRYEVTMDFHVTPTYYVSAPNKKEAKLKAWAKFLKNPPKKHITTSAEENDLY